MQNHFSLERLLNILNDRGYGYSNQRGLIESCKDGKVLEKICADLLKQCEPSYIRSILATSAYRVGEHLDNHKNSLPIISDLIVIREIFKLTKMEFRLMDFVKPTNDRIISVLSHVYSILCWEKKVNNINQAPLAKLKLIKNDFKKVKDEFASVQKELIDVEHMKVRERPKFIELTGYLAGLKTQLNQLKTQKNERLSSKYLKQKTKGDLSRQLQQLSYKNESMALQINQARLKLSQNAPEIKKQKLRQQSTLFESIKQHQNIHSYCNELFKVCKAELEVLQKQIIGELKKAKQFKQAQSVDNELNYEIDDGIRYFKGEKEKLQNVRDNFTRDQELFDDEQQRENMLNGAMAQKQMIVEEYRWKQGKEKSQLLQQQKNIAFFENGRRTANDDLDRKTKKVQQLVQKTQARLSQIQFQMNKWNEQLFITMKRVNQYFNPEQYQSN